MDEHTVLRELLAPPAGGTAVADKIAARFDLGRVRRVELLAGGAGRRNALIETDTGQWILRAGVDPATLGYRSRHLSSPIDVLRSEQFFADAIRRTTSLRAPWPYEIDDREDVLAVPYALMPRLEGQTLWWAEERDWAAVGTALAEAALALHRPAWPAAGVWSPALGGIAAEPGRLAQRLEDHIAELFERVARTSEPLDPPSRTWVEDVVAAIEQAPEPAQASLVHGDLAIGNVGLVERAGGWSVNGVFDLEVARVGDAEEDLGGLWWACYGGRPEYVPAFLGRYAQDRAISPRLRVHLVVGLLENWEYGRGHGFAWYGSARTFGEWARPLYDAVVGEIDKLL